jgi:hypothetical protein
MEPQSDMAQGVGLDVGANFNNRGIHPKIEGDAQVPSDCWSVAETGAILYPSGIYPERGQILAQVPYDCWSVMKASALPLLLAYKGVQHHFRYCSQRIFYFCQCGYMSFADFRLRAIQNFAKRFR